MGAGKGNQKRVNATAISADNNLLDIITGNNESLVRKHDHNGWTNLKPEDAFDIVELDESKGLLIGTAKIAKIFAAGREVNKGDFISIVNGDYHSTDGPSQIENDGKRKLWYKNGSLHRKNGPALIDPKYGEFWYKDGYLHREDGPASIQSSGRNEWYQHNQLHRIGGPAVTNKKGAEEWFVNGTRHRKDGPAVTRNNGATEWWINGEKHREDGPAVEKPDGHEEYFFEGKRHRIDGPAITKADGTREYYMMGVQVSEETFDRAGGLDPEYQAWKKFKADGNKLPSADVNF